MVICITPTVFITFDTTYVNNKSMLTINKSPIEAQGVMVILTELSPEMRRIVLNVLKLY